ncbi:hypothetical protein WA026_015308 [Henosepilachna vigintioctopunctata]|uniref:Uncharacterized protein n=1 Tax=Henosepilachna vigintioctopunctata TaxID=420089 RepID=A0AAW1TVB3_9CUCU
MAKSSYGSGLHSDLKITKSKESRDQVRSFPARISSFARGCSGTTQAYSRLLGSLHLTDLPLGLGAQTHCVCAITVGLRSNLRKVVTQFQVVETFGQAFIRAATMPTAINSFKTCGISLYNAHIFSEDDFIAAEATDIILDAEIEPVAVSSTPSIAATSQPTLTVTPPVISSAHDNQTATCTASNSTTNTAAPRPTPQISYLVFFFIWLAQNS